MSTCINYQEEWQLPLDLRSLSAFRRWCHSASFPERGRFDFVNGNIEVDMSPEDLFTHGTVKTQIISALAQIVDADDLGHLFVDRTRVVHRGANLSVEPDIVFVRHESIDGGIVKLVPKASADPDLYVEMEGVVDLVVEIVSDSSNTKDTQRLRNAYADAKFPEYWLVDARGASIRFVVLELRDGTYHESLTDERGFHHSILFARKFRLDRRRGRGNRWKYQLLSLPITEPWSFRAGADAVK
jgi:Uma2 family endonuclease